MKRTVTVVFALLLMVAMIVPESGSAEPRRALADVCGDSPGNGLRFGQINTNTCLPAIVPQLPAVMPQPAITGHHRKGASPDPLLRRIARQVTHSWADNKASTDELEARFLAGQRLYITCSSVSLLAEQILAHAGYRSRVVNTVTTDEFNGFDDAHSMLEVWERNRWVVYDLDGNVQPLDMKGRALSAMQLTRAKDHLRTRVLSHDSAWDARGLEDAGGSLSLAPYLDWVYEDHRAWYDRILGVPIIQEGPQMVFHDDAQRARVESISKAYHYVDQPTWRPILQEELMKGRSVEVARSSKKHHRSR